MTFIDILITMINTRTIPC